MSFDPDLGPLGLLPGVWEGGTGTDKAPSDEPDTDRQLATSKFRERMVFEPIRPVENHEEKLFGLRYSTMAWRIGSPNPFHEEVGYWLWAPQSQLIMRCFMPPRGMAILAGGHAQPDARELSLEAVAGSESFGICSSPFLLEEFKTVRYTLTVRLVDDDNLHYDEHTWMQMKDREQLFDHSDENTLRRVSP